ncbi:MAG: DJ-1/PfpI family protein [Candidatus Parcubacteria bacterium]|nr:DJ-1/PfpI family protein [Candidatus Parcubacteria bacterium]
MKLLENKKIAIVIAFRDFRDPEYFIPKMNLENNGAKITTLSSKKGIALGADGGEAFVDEEIQKANPGDFDAVLFIGGAGMVKNLDNDDFQEFARNAKIIGAICIAPALLAKAGILNGKKATVWSSNMDKSAIKILKENKAIYQEVAVVTDGNIITANGPLAADKFSQAVTEVLTRD